MTFSCLNLHAEVAHIAQLQLPALFVVAACVSLLRVVIVVCISMCVGVCVLY